MLSWCPLLCSNDHSVNYHNTLVEPLLSTSPTHLTTHCYYQLWILCIVQYLVVQCGCPLLHCLSLSGREAELPLSRSLSLSVFLPLSRSSCHSLSLFPSYICLSSVSTLCLLLSPRFFFLFFVFFFSTILYLLSRPGMQWPMSSVSLYTVESFCYTCRIGCYFLSWRHKKQTGPIDWSNDVQRYFLFLAKKKQQTNQSLTTAEAHQITEIKFVTKVFFFKVKVIDWTLKYDDNTDKMMDKNKLQNITFLLQLW